MQFDKHKLKIGILTGILLFGILLLLNHRIVKLDSSVADKIATQNSLFFGAGYTPVTGYEARLTGFLASSGATINVNTTKDRGGTAISIGNISTTSTPRIYLTLEPDNPSKEEIVYCTGVSATAWTECVRGLSFQGGSLTASTTLQTAHNAGTKIIISNPGQFFTEYLSVDGTQTKYDVLTFDSYPKIADSSTNPTADAELASKKYVDDVGAGGFTASNVSSTLGLQAISSGTPDCPTAAACVGVFASSTAAANGGYLNFASSTGRLFFDSPLFTSTALTWSGAQTFAGVNGTSTAMRLNFSPSNIKDGVNLEAARDLVSSGYATGTAGIAISIGEALYVSTTGTLFLADPAATSTAETFVGIATASAAEAAEVTFVPAHGIIDSLSGLSAGEDYYLSGTAGAITASAPAIPDLPVKIGRAISASRLQIKSPTINLRTGGLLSAIQTDQVVTLGVTPDRVDLICDRSGIDISMGWWAWNKHTGTSSTASWGVDDDAVPYTMQRTDVACGWEQGANVFTARVDATQTGFDVDVNASWSGSPRDVSYIVEYIYP